MHDRADACPVGQAGTCIEIVPYPGYPPNSHPLQGEAGFRLLGDLRRMTPRIEGSLMPIVSPYLQRRLRKLEEVLVERDEERGRRKSSRPIGEGERIKIAPVPDRKACSESDGGEG